MINIVFLNLESMDYTKIGFMQGRLVKSLNNQIQCFPKSSWVEEFKIAEKIGFGLMEWIFDYYDNPILNEKQKIDFSCKEYHIKINSICADFFMTHKLFSESESELENNLNILKKLIENSNEIGIKIIEIPLVDTSSIKTTVEKAQFCSNLEKIIPITERNNIILNLEVDLPAIELRNLISSFSNQLVRANYDVGNSTFLGYNVVHELTMLKELISNVHIKDRLIGGQTVPLGTGNVDFDSFFSTLSKINYKGDLIIQGARENEDLIDPSKTCLNYLNFVKHYLDKYFK